MSKYINTNGQEVLILKIANNPDVNSTQEVLKVFMKKEESWSEIITDCSESLNE